MSSVQQEQMASLKPLYDDWNSKINLISRKDMELFYEHHVLHSLAIAKVISFKNGTSVLDVGTGGGFPGIPLAILFPNVDFVLIDSIGKKIKVVKDVVEKLGLTNVEAHQVRAEQLGESFDFVVSRAVTDLPTFYSWIKYKVRKKGFNDLPNGILYLKGGDLQQEIADTGRKGKLYTITDFFPLPYFETKYVVYLK